jgi:soluble lytic murein transglycosylase-like protein
MRICFTLILCVGSAAVALSAADASGQPRRIVTGVRPDPRSGKLVRTVIVSSKASDVRTPAAATDNRAALDEAVRMIAAQHSLSPELLHSVIKAESNYDRLAVSPKGALGMMQLIPSTARRFGVANVFNPVENIEGGARYLRYLLDLYNDNYRLALAAYNAGERAVAKYGGVPPYSETQNYVNRVEKRLQGGGKAVPKASLQPAVAGAAHIVEIREPDGSVRYVSQ